MAEYFLEKNNDTVGPFSAQELMEQGITPMAGVWTQKVGSWVSAAALPELAKLMAQNREEGPEVKLSAQEIKQLASDKQLVQSGVRPRMSFGEAVKYCFKNQFNFSSRGRRSEFWWFMLFVLLLMGGIGLLAGLLETAALHDESMNLMRFLRIILVFVMILPLLFVILPTVAANVRRLHDTNHGGLLYFIYLIPVGALLVLSFLGFFQKAYSYMGYVYYYLPQWLIIVIAVATIAIRALLLWYQTRDSDRKENKYGSSPKYQ